MRHETGDMRPEMRARTQGGAGRDGRALTQTEEVLERDTEITGDGLDELRMEYSALMVGNSDPRAAGVAEDLVTPGLARLGEAKLLHDADRLVSGDPRPPLAHRRCE